MAPTQVIIAGCGIAGPVLGIFLKLKGYEPVIYERLEKATESGLSVVLQPNGVKVLELIPGLVPKIVSSQLQRMVFCSVVPGHEEILGESDGPSRLLDLVGSTMMGVHRPTLCRTLIQAAVDHGVEIVWGHQLESFVEHEDSVDVKFTNGNTVTGSFLIGCDGLHSNTRSTMFGTEESAYTGLTQTGGLSPTPEAYKAKPGMINVFGEGGHMIIYNVNDHETSWAVSLAEPESKESWRSIDEETARKFIEGPWSNWGFDAGTLVKTTKKIVKFGLYDRPELKSWHKGRVTLVGDAAHPTSPHLGQGANQAFEDIYHLVRVLVKYNPSAENPSTATLEQAFSEYEAIRLPRSAGLVKGARQQGQIRVVHGMEAAIKRNEFVRNMWKDDSKVVATYSELFNHPFAGKSEI